MLCPENFHRNRAVPFGFSTTCRECWKVIDRQRHPDRRADKNANIRKRYRENEAVREAKQAKNRAWKAIRRRRS
jgi:hypothetical protein